MAIVFEIFGKSYEKIVSKNSKKYMLSIQKIEIIL